MSLGVLLREWRLRLAALYRLAGESMPGQEWLVDIRIRILQYCIRRYGTRSGSEPDAEVPSVAPRPARTYCVVDDPTDHPPRPTERLRTLLEEIRRLNTRAVPAWRRWLLRLLRWNGDAPAS